ADLPEGDGSVIALTDERPGRGRPREERSPGGAAELRVLEDDRSVQLHPHEAGVLHLIPRCIEARCAELDAERLPEPRSPGGVEAGRVTLEPFVPWPARLVPPLVNASHIAVGRVLHAPAVEQLQLVAPLKVDSRVRGPGHHELELEVDVSVLPGGA